MVEPAKIRTLLTSIWNSVIFNNKNNNNTNNAELIKEILSMYPSEESDIRQTRRFYHNIYHLLDCVGVLLSRQVFFFPPTDGNKATSVGAHQLTDDVIIVLVALYYHDVIYDPQRNDNEELSSEFAQRTLNQILTTNDENLPNWLTPANIALIADMIMATKMHAIPPEWINLATSSEQQQQQQIEPPQLQTTKSGMITTPQDAQRAIHLTGVMLDVDLSILSTTPKRFDIYDKQIRQEYQHVRLDIYAEKRCEVMQRFAQRKELYFTSHFKKSNEKIAKANLQELFPSRYSSPEWEDDVMLSEIFPCRQDAVFAACCIIEDVIEMYN